MVMIFFNNKNYYCYIIFKLMNRGTEQNQKSTDRILKSKHLDKEKKTIHLSNLNAHSKKVMLTDLCPQQKAKVGELIKTLEIRKHQNEKLSQQIDEIKSKLDICQDKLLEIEKMYETKTVECQQMESKITQLQEKNIQFEVINLKLIEQSKLLNETVGIINSKHYSTSENQTENPIFTNYQTQTKHRKMKNRSIQVEQQGEQDKAAIFRPHSKSFKKIMKKGGQKLSMSPDRQSQVSENITNSNLKEEYEEEENDAAFEEMAKQWLKLKQKSIKKLEKSYEQNSKPRSVRQERHTFFNEPKQFDVEGEDKIVNISNKPSQMSQIDETELNKLLKKKNFSASRLIKNSRIDSQEDSASKSRKKSISKKVNPIKNYQIKIKEKTKDDKIRIEDFNNQGSLNLYESDLLDLVDSMNN